MLPMGIYWSCLDTPRRRPDKEVTVTEPVNLIPTLSAPNFSVAHSVSQPFFEACQEFQSGNGGE